VMALGIFAPLYLTLGGHWVWHAWIMVR
jgi:hypothetical protein